MGGGGLADIGLTEKELLICLGILKALQPQEVNNLAIMLPSLSVSVGLQLA